MARAPGRPTVACRSLCSALVLMAPIAGSLLIVNSLYCLLRYRSARSLLLSPLFAAIGAGGFLIASHFLPLFRM